MDPGTILSVAEGLAKVIAYLTWAAETIKNAPNSLASVMAETDKLRLQVERLYAKQQGMPEDRRQYLAKQVDIEECEKLTDELVKLTASMKPADGDADAKVDKGGKMKPADRFRWLWNKNDVEDLVVRLAREATKLREFITTELVMSIDEKLELLMLKSYVEQVPQFDSNGIYSPFKTDAVAWYGQFRCKPGQDLTMPYFRDRYALANAAFAGRWDEVIRTLDRAEKVYRQRWINCTTIRAANDFGMASGFRPLHQAAWHGKKSVVDYLLRNGAWRLSRTAKDTSTSLKDSTPLDIAKDHEWEHLYDLLSPVVRRPVSHKTIMSLQNQLHDLIRETFGTRPDAHLDCFLFPELDILTEFDRSRMWFPLNPELLDTREGLAVHMILERNELVVIMRWGRGKKKNYRISVKGVEEIEQAVVLR
ncbi:hypothetical protein NKR23_g9467 [Pleurostoma richardsiae]|uniref:Ankyrin repeat protein n=1 Tax=Pleurostoma richardsiae TaxID=41990 RepID=A0AA38VET4_9PEZI|nr:hypothetical protein NKR23_g9467 [Pleurostoma richardsiae]